MTVEQAVDEVEVAGAAASGADGELAGEVRLGASGEGGGLLVAGVDPVDPAVGAERVGDAVEAVADHPVDPLHPDPRQNLDDEIRCLVRHQYIPPCIDPQSGTEPHELNCSSCAFAACTGHAAKIFVNGAAVCPILNESS